MFLQSAGGVFFLRLTTGETCWVGGVFPIRAPGLVTSRDSSEDQAISMLVLRAWLFG